MAEIYDSSPASHNAKGRRIGCIELSGEMNQMLRSEEIINIKSRLEKRGWVNVEDFDQGEDEHVFVFEMPRSNMTIFPEKPHQDWKEAIGKNRSIYLEIDREMSIDV